MNTKKIQSDNVNKYITDPLMPISISEAKKILGEEFHILPSHSPSTMTGSSLYTCYTNDFVLERVYSSSQKFTFWLCHYNIDIEFHNQSLNSLPMVHNESDNRATVSMLKHFLSNVPDNWKIEVYDGRYDLISAHNPENSDIAKYFHVTDIDRYIMSKTGKIKLNEDRS